MIITVIMTIIIIIQPSSGCAALYNGMDRINSTFPTP